MKSPIFVAFLCTIIAASACKKIVDPEVVVNPDQAIVDRIIEKCDEAQTFMAVAGIDAGLERFLTTQTASDFNAFMVMDGYPKPKNFVAAGKAVLILPNLAAQVRTGNMTATEAHQVATETIDECAMKDNSI